MGRPATGSSTVARQMQDRTHKGGAVLWFLRKHSPMPLAYGFVEDETNTAAAKASSASSPGVAGATGGSANKADAGPQRKFLHGTQRVIATELDNRRRAESVGSSSRPHPHGSVMDSQLEAWGVREHLRKRYANHTDSELDQLEAAVKAKEAEVVNLRKQVEQMERYLTATRAAAARRTHRMREGTEDANRGANRPGPGIRGVSVLASSAKSKEGLLSGGTQTWDAQMAVPRNESNVGNVIEEWQHSIMRQSEISHTMRAHVDEQARTLQQHTIQRKAQEAALFSTNAQTMRVRAQAQATEARVQRLANELKRVYQSLPDTIQKKLASEGSVTRGVQREAEITALKVEHYSEFFKFLDNDSIKEESEACQTRISDIQEQTALAHQVLERGRWFAESGIQHARASQVAINALLDRWARFSAAGHPAGDLTIKDNRGDVSDDADCLLQRATLSVTALTELIDILHKGDALVHKNQEKRMLRNSPQCEEAAAESFKRVSHKMVKPGSKTPDHERDVDLPEDLAMPWSHMCD